MGTNQFAEMLKYYLMLNDKTQKDLVDDLGFDKSTVSSWCSGNRVPKIDVIIAITPIIITRAIGITNVNAPHQLKPSMITSLK